jgi:hypothetical protein
MVFPGPSAPFAPHIRNRNGIREDKKTNPILYFCEKRALGVPSGFWRVMMEREQACD